MTKDKSLKSKAIKFKDKDYVLVKDRVIAFNEDNQNGSIRTTLISQPQDEMVIINAIVIPDVSNPDRYFTGYSQATWGEGYINKTAALENCETSAIGRALASMGYGVLESLASADEIFKAVGQADISEKATDKQIRAICIGLTKFGISDEYTMDTKLKVGNSEIMVKDLNKRQASMVMGKMMDKKTKGEEFKELVVGLEEFDPFEKMPDIQQEDLDNNIF